MKKYIDFHVHIDYYENYRDIYNYYDKQQVYALFVTNFPEVYRKSKNTFPDSKYVKLALGYHPEMIDIKPFNKKEFDQLVSKTKYIGEVGLDFSARANKFRSRQIEIFSYICEKSSKEEKIMSIHSRKAEETVLEILKEYNIKYAVFHWYTGSIEILNEALKLGYYFSLNPMMLKSKNGKEIIKSIPLNRVLIETDGPYGKIKGRSILPEDIPGIYKEFERILNIKNLKEIVFQNLNELLMKQSKKT